MMRIAVAQIHSIAGDIQGNLRKLEDAAIQASKEGASILVAPEQNISGYSIEDLSGDGAFIDDCWQAVKEFMRSMPPGLLVLLGAPLSSRAFNDASVQAHGILDDHEVFTLDSLERDLYNTVLLVGSGRILSVWGKTHLPTYGVFDDSRWMTPGTSIQHLIEFQGERIALAVCEDIWTDEVAFAAKAQGATMLLVANASPFEEGKPQKREQLVTGLAKRTGMRIVYANMVGGQDEVVYDGGSMIVDANGELELRAPLFETGVWVTGKEDAVTDWPSDPDEVMWKALVTGLRDYVHGNRFEKVILGLSGGIDSAIAAVLAVDALGPENVWGIGMPGPYSSKGSVDDARELAERLRIRFDILEIKATVEAEESIIDTLLKGGPGEPVARENIQARLRALHLMTLANSHNLLMLNTGNKSEAAVGYFTLGGDSSGGYAILKDVYKTRVYQLCQWRNRQGDLAPIPESTLTKPPSAELAPDQEDTDSLPPYPLLDAILVAYLEHQDPAIMILRKVQAARLQGNLDDTELEKVILRVLGMVDRAEHKRRQVAPGLKLTAKAFGRDRRMPITSRRVHHI